MAQQLPKGLVFSKGSTKRRKQAFMLAAVLFVLQVFLIWPVYPLFSSPTPQIFGFPLSFAWVILILACSFTSLLIFYRKDVKAEG